MRIRHGMCKLYSIIFLCEIVAKRERTVKLVTGAFSENAIFFVKDILSLSLPALRTGTWHYHWFHTLVVERGCLILSSDKRKTYQIYDIELRNDVRVLLVTDWKVKPLCTPSRIHVILQHQIISVRSCLKRIIQSLLTLNTANKLPDSKLELNSSSSSKDSINESLGYWSDRFIPSNSGICTDISNLFVSLK